MTSTTINGTSVYQIEKLHGSSNYPIWKVHMKDVLTSMKAWDHIDPKYGKTYEAEKLIEKDLEIFEQTGISPVIDRLRNKEVPIPSETNIPASLFIPPDVTDIQQYIQSDNSALAQLRLHIDNEFLFHVVDCTTVKEAWQELEINFQQLGEMGAHAARKQFYRTDCTDDMSVEEHIAILKKLKYTLATLGEPISDKEFTKTLLNSLPDKWGSFISKHQYQTRSAILIPEIREEERRRKTNKEQTDTALTTQTDTALTARMVNTNRDHTRPQTINARSQIECHYCKRKGHIQRDCYKRKREQSYQIQDTNPQNFVWFVDEIALTISPDSWLADSGATSHVVKDKNKFHTYKETPGATLRGTGTLPSLGRGDVKVILNVDGKHTPITLHDCMHVPQMPHNLISLSRVTDSGCHVHMAQDKLTISYPDHSICGIANKIGKLYHMQIHHDESALVAESRTMAQWHATLGHASPKLIREIYSRQLADNMHISDPPNTDIDCTTCIQAKHHVTPFSDHHFSASGLGDVIVSDLWGPSPVTSIHGERYYVSFTDVYSRYSHVTFLKDKTETNKAIQSFVSLFENITKHKICRFHADNGTEFTNSSIKDFFSQKGIQITFSAPYSPAQNGIAERLNRTLLEKARAMLLSHNSPKFLWAEAVNYACQIKNRLPTIKQKHIIIPYHLFWHKKPNYAPLHEFGTTCWVLDQTPHYSKLNPKSHPMIFTGIATDSQAFRFFDSHSRSIKKSRNVLFPSPSTLQSSPSSSSYTLPIVSSFVEGEHTLTPTKEEPNAYIPPSDSNSDTPRAHIPLQTPNSETPSDTQISQTDNTNSLSDHTHNTDNTQNPDSNSTIQIQNKNLPTRTSNRLAGQPRLNYRIMNNPRTRLHNDTTAFIEEIALLGEDNTNTDPKTYQEAMNRPDANKWQDAMKVEMKTLVSLDTYELTCLPQERTSIGSKWVFKLKRDTNGNITKYKARLVAQGFSQRPGFDYDTERLYAPVIRLDTLRLLLAISANFDWEMEQVDIIGAYLHGKIEEDIYMRQPLGFEDGTDRVCKLKRALYGLKQSGRAWNDKLNSFFETLGLHRLTSDPCVYLFREGSEILIIGVYVDDMGIFSNSKRLTDLTKQKLHAEFNITELGSIHSIIGINVTRDRQNHTIKLSQPGYIRGITSRFGMDKGKTVHTPLDPDTKLERCKDNGTDLTNQADYQSIIGSLMYAAVGTRPDIAYAVSKLSQYSSCPTVTHLSAAKRVLAYLAHTPDLGIILGDHSDHINPIGYSDSNWATDEDDSRSISGHIFILNGPITWSSKKQPTVSRSTMEAEYRELSNASRTAIWIQNILSELQLPVPTPITIYGDNQAANTLAAEIKFHAKAKHFRVDFHAVREHITDKTIVVKYCPSAENGADLLTKPLPRSTHMRLVSLIGMA